jgi:hypothetical protein
MTPTGKINCDYLLGVALLTAALMCRAVPCPAPSMEVFGWIEGYSNAHAQHSTAQQIACRSLCLERP